MFLEIPHQYLNKMFNVPKSFGLSGYITLIDLYINHSLS